MWQWNIMEHYVFMLIFLGKIIPWIAHPKYPELTAWAYPKIRDSQQNPYIIYNPDQETISLNLCLHKMRKKMVDLSMKLEVPLFLYHMEI